MFQKWRWTAIAVTLGLIFVASLRKEWGFVANWHVRRFVLWSLPVTNELVASFPPRSGSTHGCRGKATGADTSGSLRKTRGRSWDYVDQTCASARWWVAHLCRMARSLDSLFSPFASKGSRDSQNSQPVQRDVTWRSELLQRLQEVRRNYKTRNQLIGKFAGPRHGKHIRILLFRKQAQRLIGRKTRIGDHNDLPDPCRRHKICQHLPKQDILMPAMLRVDQAHSNRDPHPIPTRDHQHDLEAKQGRLMLPMTCEVAHGMLAAPLRFERTVPNQIEHPLCWR